MIKLMKIVGLGQCALDHSFVFDTLPEPDTKKEVMQWEINGGGPVATALVSLSRLGMDCTFHGVIGDDEAGIKIINSLESENVNTAGLISRSNSNSQAAFIAVEKTTGKRTIFWKRPSADTLRPEELPDDFLKGSDFLLLDGLMPEVSLHAANMAKDKSVPVMLDAGRVRQGMIELAGLSDYVVCSEEFAREFCSDLDEFIPEKALQKMKTFNAKAVTVTLGSKGSYTMSGEKVFHTPSFNVDVFDTTGAGDVFHGGYIYGLLQNWELTKVTRFASAFAALKCRELGGRSGIPGIKEVEALLSSRDDSNNE
jgi:sulfofructose kinase